MAQSSDVPAAGDVPDMLELQKQTDLSHSRNGLQNELPSTGKPSVSGSTDKDLGELDEDGLSRVPESQAGEGLRIAGKGGDISTKPSTVKDLGAAVAEDDRDAGAGPIERVWLSWMMWVWFVGLVVIWNITALWWRRWLMWTVAVWSLLPGLLVLAMIWWA